MASVIHAVCDSCRHEWQAHEYGYLFGAFSGPLPENFEWRSCPRCLVGVGLPRTADRVSWERWRRSTARGDCGLTPFARGLIDEIEAFLPPDESPVNVRLGEIPCPGCGGTMLVGTIDRLGLVCPGCGEESGRLVAIDGGKPGPMAHPY